MHFLSMAGLQFSYQKNAVLKNLDLDLVRGQKTCLLGANGSGKTTLLKILSGLLPVTQGEVTYLDKYSLDSKGFVPRQLKKEIGVVFQENSLDKKLTVSENLFFFAMLHGVPSRVAKDRIDVGLNRLNLEKYRNSRVDTLSGGMKRKVELLRALFHKPKFLILDEPANGLDPLAFRDFWNYLRTNEDLSDTTVLFSTHQLEEAMFADRVIFLHDGKIMEDDKPARLLSKYGENRAIVDMKNELVDDVKEQFSKHLLQKFPQLQVEYENELLTLVGREPMDVFVEALGPILKRGISSMTFREPSLFDVFHGLTGESIGPEIGAIG